MQGDAATRWQECRLLDLATLKTRRLTRMNDHAAMRTFDITPGRKQIVFDRMRENSAAVLIEAMSEAGKAHYLVTDDKSGLLSLRHHKATQIMCAIDFGVLFG